MEKRPLSHLNPMDETKSRPDRTKKPDRVLGDEWLDWDSNVSGNVREGKRTFLIFSFLVLIGLISCTFIFWYLVLPRFELYGKIYSRILSVSVLAVSALLVIWYTFLFISVISKRKYFNIRLLNRVNLFYIFYPIVLKLSRLFGISRDRLGHSFIRVSNTLVSINTGNGKVLALLPRCLQRDLKKEVVKICDKYSDVIHYTAPGGNVARKFIQETNPRAIVAVACERDLVSGIQDVAPRIPVIGLPNMRPAGPCKDTEIDLDDFRNAIEFFCKDSE